VDAPSGGQAVAGESPQQQPLDGQVGGAQQHVALGVSEQRVGHTEGGGRAELLQVHTWGTDERKDKW